jgi:hypothetical protein
MSYSSNFNFGNRYKLGTRKGRMSYSSVGGAGSSDLNYNVVEQDPEAAARAKQMGSAFDMIMGGLDSSATQYHQQLKDIYDSYGKYADEYGAKAQPLIDAMTGDIKGMEGYIGNYATTLASIKDTMLNGIQVDPTSTNTREQYQGSVAASYAKEGEKQKRDMESQGLNPYANKGASREMSLARSADMAAADNQAYTDWRSQYNQDVQAQQAGMESYANLEGQQVGMQDKLLGARGVLLDGQKSITDVNFAALGAKASGYETLASQIEARRQEQLALAQQAQAQANLDNDLKQQMEAKLTGTDKMMGAGGGNFKEWGNDVSYNSWW